MYFTKGEKPGNGENKGAVAGGSALAGRRPLAVCSRARAGNPRWFLQKTASGNYSVRMCKCKLQGLGAGATGAVL